jgi:hypothetical protein
VYPLRTLGIWWMHGRGFVSGVADSVGSPADGIGFGEHPARAALAQIDAGLGLLADANLWSLPDGSPLAAETARRLACDTALIPALLGTAAKYSASAG